MSGIFGSTVPGGLNKKSVLVLAKHAQQSGRDVSGLAFLTDGEYQAFRAEKNIVQLASRFPLGQSDFFLGFSNLIANGPEDIQPYTHDGVLLAYTGIVLNTMELKASLGNEQSDLPDSKVIPFLLATAIDSHDTLEQAASSVLENISGAFSCAAVLPSMGKMILFSNTGGLYLGEKDGGNVFASERFPLSEIDAEHIVQVRKPVVVDVPATTAKIKVFEKKRRHERASFGVNLLAAEENLLIYPKPDLKRCSKCILPETMPYIKFDNDGVCNYCTNYKIRNQPKPKEDLFKLVEAYRRESGDEVLVPFSGGRDSCYALHLIVNELKLKPVTYTYDWGMVTDLGRRNISRMSAQLGIENITVAPNILKKQDNVRRNLVAWLKSPHLGMLSVLTAGDKHFFRHIEDVKKQTGLHLNLWGINPLEVTHFKAGFLGVPPDFEEERVYTHGAMKQLRYQKLRFGAMTKSLGYFNRSLWDTLSGEYYRSFTQKSDYYHIFDYWRWEEDLVDETLLNEYNWERATDTKTTWRIGDATAAFYNYAYYTAAGFTEHDTFRSNQIREGDMTREEALVLVEEENQPRYPNLKWYLDILGIDFKQAISTINTMQRYY